MTNAQMKIEHRLHNPVLGKNLVVQQHNRTVDVFNGDEGFKDHEWSRYVLIKSQLEFVKGKKLSNDVLQQVKKQIGG